MTTAAATCRDDDSFTQAINRTKRKCPIGEKVGLSGTKEPKIPVLSCEGACIRDEIARQAANLVAKEKPYGRGCHGELFTVPESAIAKWIRSAEQVVLIDGCFLRCHGRIMERLLNEDRLVQFDALVVHRKYNEIFDDDDVPEAERKAVARQVADSVLERLRSGGTSNENNSAEQACCGCSGIEPTTEKG